jgi:hypothetical protein
MKRTLALSLSALAIALTVLAGTAFAQDKDAQFRHHQPTPMSPAGIAKAKYTLRIIQNAAEADMVDGHFEPLTAGLLDGTEKNLEEDSSDSRVSRGDHDICEMLSQAEEWMVFYRVGSYKGQLPEPTRTHVMHWYMGCTHEIYVALRSGSTTGYGDCFFAAAQDKELHDAIDKPK